MRSVLLTTSVVIIVLGITTSVALGDATPTGVSYMLHENWGGSWIDAEKSPFNYEDDNMCWAAAASNVLAWTGWGRVEGMTNADNMFGYFQDHWTDQGGLMGYGWQWWMTGYNPSNGWSGWSQVDVAGGGFHPRENFSSVYHRNSNTYTAMSSVNNYLRSGFGTALAIYGRGEHAITAWGFTHEAGKSSDYTGIYITDSDDYKNHPSAPDRLRYYKVKQDGGKWYLQNYFGSNAWYIGGVYALSQNPDRLSTPGDFDGDSDVDVTDINLLASAIKDGVTGQAYDISSDGVVDSGDMDKLIRDILNTDYGDFNLTSGVNLVDYFAWANTFKNGPGDSTVGWSSGDSNADGVVDLNDYAIWANSYQGVTGTAQATPEPGTLLLLCSGGIVALSRRKTRRRR